MQPCCSGCSRPFRLASEDVCINDLEARLKQCMRQPEAHGGGLVLVLKSGARDSAGGGGGVWLKEQAVRCLNKCVEGLGMRARDMQVASSCFSVKKHVWNVDDGKTVYVGVGRNLKGTEEAVIVTRSRHLMDQMTHF